LLSITQAIKAAAAAISAEVYFNLKALPDAPAAIKLISGNAQTGVAGHKLNQDIVVAIVDQYENGVGGISTTFSPQSGHGSMSPSSEIESDSTVEQAMETGHRIRGSEADELGYSGIFDFGPHRFRGGF